MAYVAMRAMEYAGRQVTPGELLGGGQPKRSLIQLGWVAWQPMGCEPDEDPDLKSSDVAIPKLTAARLPRKIDTAAKPPDSGDCEMSTAPVSAEQAPEEPLLQPPKLETEPAPPLNRQGSKKRSRKWRR